MNSFFAHTEGANKFRDTGHANIVISEVDGDRETDAETCRRMERILAL